MRKGNSFAFSSRAEHLPDAAVAADDGVVAVMRLDVPGFAMFFHGFSYFSFGDELDQRSDEIDLAGIAGDDDAAW